jgi:MFS family permease
MALLFDSIFSSVALSHLMVDVFNASRPVLLTYLGLSETQIALYSTIYIWVSALTQPFFGWISDRVGPRWLAAGGVLWMTLFYTCAVYIPGTGGIGVFHFDDINALIQFGLICREQLIITINRSVFVIRAHLDFVIAENYGAYT